MKVNITKSTHAKYIEMIGHFIMLLMVGVVPHIYKYTEFSVPESEKIFFRQSVYADLYMLAKSRLFLFLAVMLILTFSYQVFRRYYILTRDRILYIAGFFALIVVVTSVISEYQDIVYWGAKDRFEGMWVWLAYIAVFMVAKYYGSNKEFVYSLVKTFIISASIMAIFGLLQVLDYDVYTESLLRWICFPKEIASDMGKYMVTNTTDVLAVGALYNSNYFGVYCAMASLLAMLLSVRESSKTLIWSGASGICYIATVVSGSEAALLGFAVAISIAILLNFDMIKLKFKIALLNLSLMLLGNILVSFYFTQEKTTFYIYILMMLGIMLAILIKIANFKNIIINNSKLTSFTIFFLCVVAFATAIRMMPVQTNPDSLVDLKLNQNKLSFQLIGDDSLVIEAHSGGINARNGMGELVETEVIEADFVVIKSKKYNYGVKFKHYTNGYVINVESPINMNFFYDGNSLSYVNTVTGVQTIDYPKRVNSLYNKSEIFSTRGYIWSTFIPLSMDKALTGYGVDTYINVFPQNDVVGKYNSFYWYGLNTIVDKPHSMYLMIFLSMGVTGLAVYVICNLSVLNRLILLIWDSKKDMGRLLIPILIVFLIAGLFNDSIIAITLIASIFYGVMMSEEQ